MAGRYGPRLLRRPARSLAAGTVLVAALAIGCGEDRADTTPTQTTAAVKLERVPRDRWSYARARFREMCAGCHTLADAGATGRRYNLDAVPHLNEQLVRETILRGGPGMPAFSTSIAYREYEQLAAYILDVAERQELSEERGWQWQIHLRREGERDRPRGWPDPIYLRATRYNP